MEAWWFVRRERRKERRHGDPKKRDIET